MLLDGRRIIVTGGASGIGAASVRAYVQEAARVISLDVDDARGKQAAAEAGAEYLHCDVSRREEVEPTFAQAVNSLGGLDALVNCAGIERNTPAEKIDDAEWDLMFAVHLKGTLHTCQTAFVHLRERGGRIINFGSGAAVRGQPGAAHYTAAKGGVMAFTRTLALEWAVYGITVNAVLPAIWTPMYDQFRSHLSSEQLAVHDRGMAMAIPLGGRLGDPERDLAPVMVFLASEGSRFMTGQAFCVDGGMIMLD